MDFTIIVAAGPEPGVDPNIIVLRVRWHTFVWSLSKHVLICLAVKRKCFPNNLQEM